MQLQDEPHRWDDDGDVTATPLREYARKWLGMVPAMWYALFRPLFRLSWDTLGGSFIALIVVTAGGIPGALAALDLVGHLWGIPALAVMLIALVVGAIVGASVGILIIFLPWVVTEMLLERWVKRDRKRAMDETDVADLNDTDTSEVDEYATDEDSHQGT